MRRPHLSTGAWIFASVVTVSLIGAPAAVYAASTSTVSIGNPTGTTTANVDPEKQLLSNAASPSNVVDVLGEADPDSCETVYTPPAGKAIVVTHVTYDLGTGTAGQDMPGSLTDANCGGFYDLVDTTQPYETETRT